MPWKYLDHKLLCCPSHSFYPTFLNIHLYYSVRFCLLRAFVSAQRSGAPEKRGGFCDKKDSEEVELVRKASDINSEKVSKPWQEGLEELPTTCYCVSRVFQYTHNLLTILRSASWYLNLRYKSSTPTSKELSSPIYLSKSVSEWVRHW